MKKKEEKMLLVVVGRSGTGKSTFIEAMGLPEYHCVLSAPMVEEVKRRGLNVDHDSIHSLAKEWYAANPWWQLEYVLEQFANRQFLILDGLRYGFELRRLRELFPDRIVVLKVISCPEDRFRRLKSRGKIPLTSLEEFLRLERDESEDMDLEEILAAADISVENNDGLDQLQAKARKFAALLRYLPQNP